MAARLVVLAVLMALAAASLAPSAVRQPDPPAPQGWLSLAVLAILTLAALVPVTIAGVRYRQPRTARPRVPRGRNHWLGIVILLGMLAIVGAVTVIAPWLLLVLAAAPFLIMAARLPRRRTRDPEPVARHSDPLPVAAEPTRHRPLTYSAIVRCYAAMEDALAGHPEVAPRPADSPSEVVSRASASGVLRTPAAWRLVELFDEARFSPHTMTPHDRAEAESLLRAVLAELGATR
jgi:hypothetical protein